MYKIIKKEKLNDNVRRMTILAPLIASSANPGQFIIVRAFSDSERIPLTISDFNKENGTVSIIYQVVGASTMELDTLNEGEFVNDFVGPLGNKTDIDGVNKVAIVGGGVGCAIALPIAKALSKKGVKVDSIIGFRNKDLIILENEFKKVSEKLVVMTDDGSGGEKGLVTNALEKLILDKNKYDKIFAIGPLVMMKFVTDVAKKYNIPVVVSMNPIMIDGTGMCGGCRLTVDGKTKFACVDGPDFDGNLVDFDEALKRNGIYKEFEKHKREENCNLLK